MIAAIAAGGVVPFLVIRFTGETTSTSTTVSWEIPNPDTSEMDLPVARMISEARDAVYRQPSSAGAWGRLAAVLDAHHIYRDANRAYRRASILAPGDIDFVYNRACVLELLGGDPQETLGLLERVAAHNPDFAPVFFRLGRFHFRQSNLQEAREAYEQAISLDETLAIAHCNLGQIMVSVGELNEAVRHLERAAELAPTDGRVQAVTAKAYARLGDGRRAAEAEAKARRLHATLTLPDPIRHQIEQLGVSKERYFSRARALIEAGNYAEAAVQLASAVEDFPEDPDTEFWLGICYMKTDRPALAIEHLSNAVRMKTDHFAAHAAMGSILLSKEDLDLAISHLRRALARAPIPALQHAELATALAGTDRLDEAITEFERAAELAPLDAQMHNNWGFALFHQGRFQAAIEQYRLALQRDPNYVTAHYHLGAALEKLDRKAEAIEAYREALRLDPEHQARERLRALGVE